MKTLKNKLAIVVILILLPACAGAKPLKHKELTLDGLSYSDHNSFFNDGKKYTLTKKGRLTVEDVDGHKLWQTRLAAKKMLFKDINMSFDKNDFYISYLSNRLIKMSSVVNSTVWEKELNSVVASNLIFDEKNLYLFTNNNSFYAINKSSSRINWVHSDVANSTYISGFIAPLFYKSMLIVPYSSGSVFFVQKSDGKTLGSIDLTNGIRQDYANITMLTDIKSQPLIYKDVLYLANNSRGLFAIDLNKLEVRWKMAIRSTININIVEDILYIINDLNELYSISLKDNKVLWKLPLDKFYKKKIILYGRPEIIDGRLWLHNNMGHLLEVEAETGIIIKELELKKTANKKIIYNNKEIFKK